MKRLFLKNKIVSVFFIFIFLFTQFTPVTANAMIVTDIIKSIFDFTEKLSAGIEKIGGGIISSGIATTLNSFAQTLATNTLNSIANDGSGQQPLFKQFSLETMMQQAADGVTGQLIDEIAKTEDGKNFLDAVCRPWDISDVSWKLKLTLNIFGNPPTKEPTKYACTISTIVDNAKKTMENVTTSLRKTFLADCFDEFKPNYSAGAIDAEVPYNVVGQFVIKTGADLTNSVTSGLSGLVSWSYDDLKKAYFYDVKSLGQGDAKVSYFSKKVTYYKQKKPNSKCTSYKATTSECDHYSTTITKDSNGNDVTSTTCDLYKDTPGSYLCKLNEGGEAGLNKSPKCETSLGSFDPNNIGNGNNGYVDSGPCISYSFPDRGSDGKYVPDTAKQKKFINQYKNCYLKKMNDAFSNLIEFGQTPDISRDPNARAVKIEKDCDVLVRSIFDSNFNKNAAEYFINFKKNKSLIDISKTTDYKGIMASALVAPNGSASYAGFSFNGGDFFKSYISKKINFYGDFEQALINCNTSSLAYSECSGIKDNNGSDNKGVGDGYINSDDYSVVFSPDSNAYISDFSQLMLGSDKSSLLDHLKYDEASKTLSYQDDFTNVIKISLSDDGVTLRWISSTAKIEESIKDMVSQCVTSSMARYSLIGISQNEANKRYVNAEKTSKEAEITKKQAEIIAETPGSTYKPKEAVVSGDVKTMVEQLETQANQAMTVGSTMLKPTGNLFIDPIQIFLATFIQEGSKKAMQGLFKVIFPLEDINENLSDDINDIQETENPGSTTDSASGSSSGTINNVVGDGSFATGVSAGASCKANSDCKSKVCILYGLDAGTCK